MDHWMRSILYDPDDGDSLRATIASGWASESECESKSERMSKLLREWVT